MKPKVASRFTQKALIVIVNFLVTHAARIDRRCVRILWIEDHRCVNWVDFAGAHWHRLRPAVHPHRWTLIRSHVHLRRIIRHHVHHRTHLMRMLIVLIHVGSVDGVVHARSTATTHRHRIRSVIVSWQVVVVAHVLLMRSARHGCVW